MEATVYTIARVGDKHRIFEVTSEVQPGIGIHVVGLSDESVSHSLLRTITAMRSLGYHIPGKKIVVTIKTDGTGQMFKMTGSSFDLPIAVSILLATEQIKTKETVGQFCIIGELALDGCVRYPEGLLSGYEMYKLGRQTFRYHVAPFDTASQAVAFVPRNIFTPNRLDEVVEIIQDPEGETAKSCDIWNTTNWLNIVAETMAYSE